MEFANDLQTISFNEKQTLMSTMYFLIQNVMILIMVKLITVKHMLKYNKSTVIFYQIGYRQIHFEILIFC